MDFSLTMSGVNQSEIALAAILNTMSGVSSTLFSSDDKNEFVKTIERCSGVDSQSLSIKMARKALWALYHRSAQCSIYDSCKIATEMRSQQCTFREKHSEGVAGHMPPEVSEIIEVVDADNDDKIGSPRKSATKKMSHRHRHRHYSNE